MPDPKPSLRDLLVFLSVASVESGQELIGRVRLTKLLYLLEVEHVRRTGQRLTEVPWIYHFYGPYAGVLEDEFRRLPFSESEDEGTGFRGWRIKEWELQRIPDPKIPERVAELGGRIARRWATERIGALLDYVYYETEPMYEARKGEALRFETIAPSQPVPRPVSTVAESLKKRLAGVGSPFVQGPTKNATPAEATNPPDPDADLSSVPLASIEQLLRRANDDPL